MISVAQYISLHSRLTRTCSVDLLEAGIQIRYYKKGEKYPVYSQSTSCKHYLYLPLRSTSVYYNEGMFFHWFWKVWMCGNTSSTYIKLTFSHWLCCSVYAYLWVDDSLVPAFLACSALTTKTLWPASLLCGCLWKQNRTSSSVEPTAAPDSSPIVLMLCLRLIQRASHS